MSDQEGINHLLDEEKYMAIVNASGWPTTKMITVINKAEFLEGLINQEVVDKRDVQIAAFGKGLEQFGILTIIRSHPETLRPVFVRKCTEATITPEDLLGLISCSHTDNTTMYKWFKNVLKSVDTEVVQYSKLLYFIRIL